MYFDDNNPSLILQNNTPSEDFCGMTPAEIHHLLYDGWTDRSPLRLQPAISNQTLDLIPYFRILEEFVRLVKREQPVKLTALGFLPGKIVRELYDLRFIPNWYIDLRRAKVLREFDSAVITSVHSIAKASGLVKNVKNKLYLTKKGEKLLHSDARNLLFREILVTFTQKWAWGNLDGYEEAFEIQRLWGFSIHLLFQFGHSEEKVSFYSQKFLVAFPLIAEQFPLRSYSNPMEDFERCYSFRTFEHFFDWWGLIKTDEKKRLLDWRNQPVSASTLLQEVFFFE
ncbi:MAG: hypothetical protein WCK09_12040 [Bacteroidota bacterium]